MCEKDTNGGSEKIAADLLRRRYHISIVQPLPDELRKAAKEAGEQIKKVIQEWDEKIPLED